MPKLYTAATKCLRFYHKTSVSREAEKNHENEAVDKESQTQSE